MSGRSGRESRIDEILEMARVGLTDKEIAVKLGVSPTTVATYWKRVRARVGARSRAAAIAHYDAIRIQGLEDTLDALPMAVAIAANGAFAIRNKKAVRLLRGVDPKKIRDESGFTANEAQWSVSSIPWRDGTAFLLVSS